MRAMMELGLGPKELAHLLGTSVKTIHRGSREGGTVDLLIQEINAALDDPHSAPSIRALAIIAARGGGLQLFLHRLMDAYVTLDLLRVR